MCAPVYVLLTAQKYQKAHKGDPYVSPNVAAQAYKCAVAFRKTHLKFAPAAVTGRALYEELPRRKMPVNLR